MNTLIEQISTKQLLTLYAWVEAGWKLGSFKPFMFKAGVYIIISRDKLLYVGSSNSLGLRVSGHEKITQAAKAGYQNIRAFMLEVNDHKDMEVQLIKDYAPLMNKQHSHLRPQQEFLAEIELYDKVTIGRGKEIAKKCGITYNAYLNYRAGRGKNVKIMTDILFVTREMTSTLKHYLNSLNILINT